MRRVFFSFDWDDVWRANQVRNSWVAKRSYKIAGFRDVAEIEKVKRHSDKEIKNWIDKQMKGTSVTCVLIGSKTNKSKWVKYEVEKSIEKGNGLFGILIHNLKNPEGKTDKQGENMLEEFNKEENFGAKVKKAFVGGGVGLWLARLVFPQFTIPLTFMGAVLGLSKSDDSGDDYKIYDWFDDNGYENLGDWIEKSAQQVGR